jgi:hypothetical protein
MEVACLARILRRAKRWHLIAGELRPLPERRDIGRVLTPEQKAMRLTTASRRPEWQVAYLATFTISSGTRSSASFLLDLSQTLFAQFNQLTLRVLIVRIQLDRPRICHTRILDIVRRLVTISKAVPRIRGIGISLCIQFEQHDG